ncbi:MAG: tryptophan 2,3-dioxygenase [Candidatus Marinimicrobia bacterium]|nr:tryptophan 2,3-dioxygenase [Candidatus Neomarinimicrobiota bacterium]|tara:strand:+ start:549 stop:1637 length:1089 start_codon:yes stop_codon:yes gene_type:complete
MKNKKLLNYSDYLRLDKILNSQDLMSAKRGSPAHDEMLFIVVHQVYELWFKQILHELESVIVIFKQESVIESDVSFMVLRLNRIIEIQKILIDQIRVLETMTAMDFLEFRDDLFPSSGFQSAQFRLLENKLGLLKKNRMSYGRHDYSSVIKDEEKAHVLKSENERSLFELLESWLERTPFLSFQGFNFWEQYSNAIRSMLEKEEIVIKGNPNYTKKEVEYHLVEHNNAVSAFEAMIDEKKHSKLIENKEKRLSHKATQAALLILLYRDEPILHSPFNLLSKLIDMDELFTSWRQRHALMVRRMIGSKIGTGGSSGHAYLHAAADKHKIFTDLADLSTFFIPRSALPKLPEKIKQNLGYHFKS